MGEIAAPSSLLSAGAPVRGGETLRGGATLSAEAQARIEETAREFEALVIAELLKPLFESAPTPGLTGGGPEQDAFESLLQTEYATAIADRGGFGIADQVKASLIQLQSAASAENQN
ncbi:MAG: rod-binding protein [Pseudomonadota bacterium]